MGENPFTIIEGRLSRLEDLLLDLKQTFPHTEEVIRDIGGVEVAVEETGLSTHSIYRLVSERKLPHSKRGGRLYFSRKSLKKWIEAGQRPTTT